MTISSSRCFLGEVAGIYGSEIVCYAVIQVSHMVDMDPMGLREPQMQTGSYKFCL